METIDDDNLKNQWRIKNSYGGFRMRRTDCLFFLKVVLFWLCGLFLCGTNINAQPTIKIVTYPDIRTIPLGIDPPPILIVAQVSDKGVISEWSIDGPGELKTEGKEPIGTYKTPAKIEGKSANVTITVTVIDDTKTKVSERIVFTLLAPGEALQLTPTPTPTFTLTPIPTSTPTSIPTPTPIPIPILTPTPTPIPELMQVDIRQVLLKEESGTFITPTYFVNPAQEITIITDVTPLERKVKVEYKSIFGRIEEQPQKTLYIAPAKSGKTDVITIRVIDEDSGEVLIQRIIHINIQ